MLDKLDALVGLPYDARHMDCADLAMRVQAEVFGRAVALPGKRPRPLRDADQAAAIAAYAEQLALPVDTPQDGDAVLMRDSGHAVAGHIGTYFFINYTPMVLHTSHTLGASVLHRIQDLAGFGLRIEGYFKWL